MRGPDSVLRFVFCEVALRLQSVGPAPEELADGLQTDESDADADHAEDDERRGYQHE